MSFRRSGTGRKTNDGGRQQGWTLTLRLTSSVVTLTAQGCKITKQAPSSSSSSSSSHGWTYASPSHPWALRSSRDLLRATHRPREQALPSYTNVGLLRDGLSAAADRCVRARRSSSASDRGLRRARRTDWTEDSYDVSDVYRTEATDVSVEGVGRCAAVDLWLRPKRRRRRRRRPRSPNNSDGASRTSDATTTLTSDTTMITSLTTRSSNRSYMQSYSMLQTSKHRSELEGAATLPTDDDDDDGENTTTSSPIVLTFAVPAINGDNDDDDKESTSLVPCLLWRVSSFPTDPASALETLTVLDSADLVVRDRKKSQKGGGRKRSSVVPGSVVVPGLRDRRREEDGSAPTHVHVNGWQSWSYAGSVARRAPQPRAAMPSVCSRAFDRGGAPPPTRRGAPWYCSDLFASIARVPPRSEDDEDDHADGDGPVAVLGWLAQRSQFGVVTLDRDLEEDLSMHCSCDSIVSGDDDDDGTRTMRTDWAYCELSVSTNDEAKNKSRASATDRYYDLVARHHGVDASRSKHPLTVGWCSWYHYYDRIDAAGLLDNFERLGANRFSFDHNLAMIDDGYATAWGDWDSLKPRAFPGDVDTVMRSLSDAVRRAGGRPGLWLAPYACDRRSRVAREHPDWILRNERGRPANSSNCGKWFFGLDATNPEVRAHVANAVRRAVRDWGFAALKLDFLYAACLEANNRRDPSLTRAEIMRGAVDALREAAGPDVFLIGCGCPLGSAIGALDAVRVSADTGPDWYPSFPLPWWDDATQPSTRGALRNTLARVGANFRWWYNDPDCLCLRDTTGLTDREVVSAVSVAAMTGGAVTLLSDDLTKVSRERLSLVERTLPAVGAAATPLNPYGYEGRCGPNVLRLECSDEHDNNNNNNNNKNKRSVVRVAQGLGSWYVTSLSNWKDSSATVSVSADRCRSPPSSSSSSGSSHGLHVLGFWEDEYRWIPEPINATFGKRLRAHETEILVVKDVRPHRPQYVGSTWHFSGGREVAFVRTEERLRPGAWRGVGGVLVVGLRNDLRRDRGRVTLYVPGDDDEPPEATVGDERADVEVVARVPKGPRDPPERATAFVGRVVRVPVSLPGGGGGDDDDDAVVVTVRY